MLVSLIKTLRIKHWVKNFFVFAPFLVGTRFGFNEYLVKSLEGVFIFCLISSSIYVLNDIIDIDQDRNHPDKRFRPIASGEITIKTAILVSAVLLVIPLTVGYFLNFYFFLILIGYAFNNLLYSFYLKTKTVIDVISIAIGFVLRVFAGGFVIGIEITDWLVACVFAVSLVFGFGKRRTEYTDLKQDSIKSRKVQEYYSVEKLNVLLGISASITIVTYMLYTLSPETKALHNTDNLIFTTPIVIYAIYRYMLKVQEEKQGSPVELLLQDTGFLAAGFLWLGSLMVLMHL